MKNRCFSVSFTNSFLQVVDYLDPKHIPYLPLIRLLAEPLKLEDGTIIKGGILFYASNHCECVENYNSETGEHTYTFKGKCKKTGKPYEVIVPAQGLFNYNQGMLIQNAFPDLSADDREFLMSGLSPEGWKLVFGRKKNKTKT